MKVLVYAPTFYPPVVDGTSIQAQREVVVLSRYCEVSAVTYAVDRDLHPWGAAGNEAGVQRLPVEFLECETSGRFRALDGRGLADYVRAVAPDVLVARGWYQFQAMEAMLDAKLPIKVFWHVDGLHECHAAMQSSPAYRRILLKIKEAQVVLLALSPADRRLLAKLGFEPPWIAELPVITDNHPYDASKDWDQPQLLSLGRFVESKGHDLVCQAAATVGLTAATVIAGAADTEQSRETLRRLESCGVQLVLNPAIEQVHELYKKATHFVSGSRVESFGVAAIEAVTAGCIPLVRDTGGIGSFLPPECLYDRDLDLALKLQPLLFPQRAKAVSISLNSAREKFSYDRVQAMFGDFFSRLG